MSRVVRRLALAAAALVALVAVAAGVAVTCCGAGFLVFRSGSMAPAISTGSLALAVPVPVARLQPGDVVSVTAADGQRVTHRLVSATPRDGATDLELRGDANASPDAEVYRVSDDAEVDRVVTSVPVAGTVVAHAVTPPGLVAGGAVLLMLAVGLGGGGGRRRVGVALVAAMAVVGGAVGVAQTSGTWAYFTDTATYQSGTFTAGTLSPPTGVACRSTPQGFYVTWTAPAGSAVTYNVSWSWNNGLLGSGSGNDAVPSGTSWRPAPAGLILSRTYTVSVTATSGSWTSSPAASTNRISVTPGGTYSCV